MALLVQSFEGFGPAAHDAFRPEKWRSNQYNLERRRVREGLEIVGAAARDRLKVAAGLELEVACTPENPTLWNGRCVQDLCLYLMRSQADRRRMGGLLDKGQSLQRAVLDPASWAKHLVMFVRVNLGGVEVGMTLPEGAWPDRDNASAALADPEAAARVGASLEALDDGWQVRSSPPSLLLRFPRDGGEAATEAFMERAAETLLAVSSLYRIVAWAEDNDRIDLDRRIAEDAESVRAHAAEADEARRLAQEAHAKRAEEASKRAREARASREAAEAAFRKLSGPPKPSVARRVEQAQRPPRPPRDRPKTKVWPEGTEVVLSKGLLAGKRGLVRAQMGYTVTVDVGGIEVRVESRDLRPAQKES